MIVLPKEEKNYHLNPEGFLGLVFFFLCYNKLSEDWDCSYVIIIKASSKVKMKIPCILNPNKLIIVFMHAWETGSLPLNSKWNRVE